MKKTPHKPSEVHSASQCQRLFRRLSWIRGNVVQGSCFAGRHDREEAGRGGEGQARSPTPASAEDGISGSPGRRCSARLQQHAGRDLSGTPKWPWRTWDRPRRRSVAVWGKSARQLNAQPTFTRQLLAFARKQAVAPKVLDLNETVASMLQMLRRLVGENVNLVWLPDVELYPVRVGPIASRPDTCELVCQCSRRHRRWGRRGWHVDHRDGKPQH